MLLHDLVCCNGKKRCLFADAETGSAGVCYLVMPEKSGWPLRHCLVVSAEG